MKKLYLLLFVSVILSACWTQQNAKLTGQKEQTANQVKQTSNNQTQQNQEVKGQTTNQTEQTNPWWANQPPVWWPDAKVLEKMKNVKTVNDCDKLFTKKEDLLACKRQYIIKNADKLTVKVCDNIKDKQERTNCTNFFKSKSNPQQPNSK